MLNQVVLPAGAAYDSAYPGLNPLPITCKHTAIAGASGLSPAKPAWYDPPCRPRVLIQNLRKRACTRETWFCVQGVKVLRCLSLSSFLSFLTPGNH